MAPWLRVVKVKVRGEENKPTDTDDNDCGATDPLSYHSSWALSWLWWKRKGGTEMAVTPPKAKACEGEARESPTNVACDGASVWPWKAWPQDAHEELHASAPTPAPPPVLLAGVVGGGKRSAREEAIEEMRYAAAKIAFVAEADIDLVLSAKFVARVAQLAACILCPMPRRPVAGLTATHCFPPAPLRPPLTLACTTVHVRTVCSTAGGF